MCQDGANTICWNLSTDYIYDLAPPDTGPGKKLKFWFGVYLYEWLWDSAFFSYGSWEYYVFPIIEY